MTLFIVSAEAAEMQPIEAAQSDASIELARELVGVGLILVVLVVVLIGLIALGCGPPF